MGLKLTVLAGIMLLAASVDAEEARILKTPNDIINYSIGVEVVKNFKKQGMEVALDLVIKGMRDSLSGEKLLISEKEIRRALNSFQADIRKKQALTAKSAGEENRKRGAAFQEENRLKEGVVTLPSGVQYKILTAGNGRKPTDADTVECSYRGILIDGTEFDATEQGKVSTFKVMQTITGWREALKLMPAGSRWQIVIPSHLGYGSRGVGRDIGPNETLIYEVELHAVK